MKTSGSFQTAACYSLSASKEARSAHVAIPRNDLNVWAADIWAVKVMTASEVLVTSGLDEWRIGRGQMLVKLTNRALSARTYFLRE